MPMQQDGQPAAGADGVQQHDMPMQQDGQPAAGADGVQQHDMPMQQDGQPAAGVEPEVAADGNGAEAAPQSPGDAGAPSTPGKDEAGAPSTPGKEQAEEQATTPAAPEPEVPAPDQEKLDRVQQQLVLNWLGRRATPKRGTPASKQEAANAKELYMTLTNAPKGHVLRFLEEGKR